MDRFLIWYKDSDGINKFKSKKDKDSAWEFIKSDEVKIIDKVIYVRWYENVFFNLLNILSKKEFIKIYNKRFFK